MIQKTLGRQHLFYKLSQVNQAPETDWTGKGESYDKQQRKNKKGLGRKPLTLQFGQM